MADSSWVPSTPRRVFAIVLSVVFWPGLGQVLLGRMGWAALWVVVPVLSMALIPLLGGLAALMVILPRLFAGLQAAVMKGARVRPEGGRTAMVLALLFFGMCTAVGGIRRDVVESLGVQTPTMAPGFLAGDMLVIDKTAYGWRLPFIGKVGKSAVQVGDVVAYVDGKGRPGIGRVLALGPTTFAIQGAEVRVGGLALAQILGEGPCRYEELGSDRRTWRDVPCRRFEERAPGASGRAWTVLAPGDAAPATLPPGQPEAMVPEGHALVVGDNRAIGDHAVVPLGAISGRPSLVWFSTAGQRGVRWGRLGERR
jgi:signal peptidase I